jgi:hypothetical protein
MRGLSPSAVALAVSLLLAAPCAHAQLFGSVTIGNGASPDPQTLSGTSGGTIDASTLDPSCRGFVTPQPSHALVLPAGMPFLRVFAASSTDTTLVIRTPGGRFVCADDTFDTNPGIDAAYGPGIYHVWVGSYRQGEAGAYTLTATSSHAARPGGATATATANPSLLGILSGSGGGALTPNAGSRRGALSLGSGFLPDPRRVTGTAGGPIDASAVDSSCRGYVSAAPQHVLTLTTAMPFLRVYVQSRSDTTLVVRRPDGTFSCADDSYGLNPSVEGAFPAGTYQVWVGSYLANSTAPYRLSFTELPRNHP